MLHYVVEILPLERFQRGSHFADLYKWLAENQKTQDSFVVTFRVKIAEKYSFSAQIWVSNEHSLIIRSAWFQRNIDRSL